MEGETLACGTGTVAAALALAGRGEADLPLRFRSRGGPELAVRAELEGTRGHRGLAGWPGAAAVPRGVGGQLGRLLLYRVETFHIILHTNQHTDS